MLSRVVLTSALLAAGADAFMPSTPSLTSLRTSSTQLSATKINVNNIKAGEAKVVDQVTLLIDLFGWICVNVVNFFVSVDPEAWREGSVLPLLEEWNVSNV